MSTPILTTKLYIPPPRPQAVHRPRLIERLNAGLQRKLTLISAPAGFGKTTLVGEWIAECERPTAWLSLDERDNDPARFLLYVVAALQTIARTIGTAVMGALQSPQPPPIDFILTALLNDITTLPNNVVLVLDDYHVIDAKPVDDALTFMIEHLPPMMHLVITTREDPQLPLARLRVQGQMTELRAADLRFSTSEAADFLNRVMGLDLVAQDIAALEERTEGWIAGLQLAALSIQGHQDVPGFIRAFAGDHRYIADYLVEEVLGRQPEGVRNFLIQTAILDRLNGPLCDAVTGQAGGTMRLEALKRGNFFIVPLDDRRQWYRYHHLFAEVLATYLMAEQPDQVVGLHHRASVWYEQHGLMADAIHHALAAGDFERVAFLVELAVPGIRRNRQDATLLGWLKALPDDVLHVRPVLSAVYGGVLLASGELQGVEARLRDAEQWLDTTAETPERQGIAATCPERSQRMVVVDDEAFRLLPGSIAVWRAGLALVLGDLAGTEKYARQALDLVPPDDHLGRGGAAGLLGLAAWTSGDLKTAYRTFTDGMASVQLAGHLADAINGAITRADIRTAQGRLHEAIRIYEQALELATEQGEAVPRGTADLYVGMSELHRECNDLHAAMQHLNRSKELGERTGFPPDRSRFCVAMADIRQAEGDLYGALDLLAEAERQYVRGFFPNVRPVAALKARVWVAQGRLGEALNWAREHGITTHDELSYLREFEHTTLARVLLAQYVNEHTERSLYAATALLHRLLEAAEAGGRTGSVIEILVVQALAHQMHGDIPAALVPLERALALAEPEGYVRMFADEGPAMAVLLLESAARGVMPAYTAKLLAAFPERQSAERKAQNNNTPAQRSTLERSTALTEPLSWRELEVLRLFKTELSGPEIANVLMIALSTVRTYTKSIYSKLDVNNRRAAVKRAEELGLI